MSGIKLKKRLFGTNGVRGVVGKDMNPALAYAIGCALGTMRPGKVAVGRDTRTSGPSLAAALKGGLMATGCGVTDCGILPTPALQYLVREGYDAGAVVTASHNPPEYNGIKVIEPDGTEMGDEETIKLEELVLDRKPEIAPWDAAGSEIAGPDLVRDYIEAVLGHFPPNIGRGMTVAVDPGSGAACFTTPEILTRLGCRVFTLNSTMDGTFPGRLPEPSPEGLAPLAELVRSTGASFGVAHDGDADRAVFLDGNGDFLEENREFALIANHICRMKKGAVVMPVSTSMQVEAVARRNGSDVVYTAVGSIYVARTMRALAEGGTPVVLGGEGNGGIIYPDHQYCRDGAMTAAMMVAILAGTKKPLSTLAGDLPSFHMIKDKVSVRDPQLLLDQIEEHFRDEQVDRTDGVRINRPGAWALVRASGTEPLVRILAESDNEDTARNFYQEIRQILNQR
jgi:phosphomannomutase/phosphoglucomutase